MAEQDDLLTCAQVADMKKVHIGSVYRAIKEGRLDAQQMGDIYVIPRSAAERWRARSGRWNESQSKG